MMAVFRECSFLLAIILCVEVLGPDNANAGYLDPASGSSLIQGIIAAVAAVRRFFFRLIGKKE